MRLDRLYLEDIVDAADSVAAFLAGVGKDRFVDGDLLRSAVLHKLTVIGEAGARISAETRARSPSIPWVDMVGFRNLVVHAYFGVDWGIT